MITQAELKERFEYNPVTGHFTHLSQDGGVKIGTIAGAIQTNGYWRIGFKGRQYRAHRLAHLYMVGKFPANQMDHINGIRTDNTWSNLRTVTPSQNAFNRPIRVTNTSGYKDVSRRGNKWIATFKQKGIRKYLGQHSTPEEAYKTVEKHARNVLSDLDFKLWAA